MGSSHQVGRNGACMDCIKALGARRHAPCLLCGHEVDPEWGHECVPGDATTVEQLRRRRWVPRGAFGDDLVNDMRDPEFASAFETAMAELDEQQLRADRTFEGRRVGED